MKRYVKLRLQAQGIPQGKRFHEKENGKCRSAYPVHLYGVSQDGNQCRAGGKTHRHSHSKSTLLICYRFTGSAAGALRIIYALVIQSKHVFELSVRPDASLSLFEGNKSRLQSDASPRNELTAQKSLT